VAARDANHEAFDRSEDRLVDAARIHTINDLQRVASFWRQRVERDRLAEGLRARRRLHASVSFEGMVRVDGDLDPEAGETLLTALRAVMDAGSRTAATTTARHPSVVRMRSTRSVVSGWTWPTGPPCQASDRT
jgi:hypothetical protein